MVDELKCIFVCVRQSMKMRDLATMATVLMVALKRTHMPVANTTDSFLITCGSDS